MTLGQRIHTLRSAAGLSQEQLAERLDVSRQAISKWELGASAPDLDKLILLGNLFGVSLDQLVKGEPNGPPRGELDIQQLAAENRQRQRMTVLAVAGSAAILLGGLFFVFLKALESAVLGIQYTMYRFMAVGEYVGEPASFQLPLLLSGAVLAAGLCILLIFLRERRRSR